MLNVLHCRTIDIYDLMYVCFGNIMRSLYGRSILLVVCFSFSRHKENQGKELLLILDHHTTLGPPIDFAMAINKS